MAAKVLKFWHQWSWAYHIAVTIIMGTALVATYYSNTNANASTNAAAIARINEQNLPTRMAVVEKSNSDIEAQLSRIEMVQSKMFDRINQIADRSR